MNQTHLPRTFKTLTHHLLFAYLDQNSLVLKLHPKYNPKLTCLTASVSHCQLPLPLQINFENLQEVLADIAVTDASKISVDPLKGLNLQLQVGSKQRNCYFALSEQRYGYQEEIEWLMWQFEGEQRKTEETKADVLQVNQLKLAVERQSRQIAHLAEQLLQSKEIYKHLQEQYNQLHLEHQQLVQQLDGDKKSERLKTLEETLKEVSQQLRDTNRMSGKDTLHNNREEEQKSNTSYRETNKNVDPRLPCSSFSSEEFELYEKFEIDPNLTNESEPNSFVRVGKRFKLCEGNQKAKMVTSLTHLPQPKGKVIFKVINSKHHLIWVGLQLQQRLHLTSTKRDPGCVSYKLSGGKALFEDGVQSGIVFPQIGNLEAVSLEVNQKLGTASWSRLDKDGKEKKIVKRALPLSFKDKELYPFVTMIDEEDEIQFV